MLEGVRWRSRRVSSSCSAWRRENSRMFCSKRSSRLTGSFSRSARAVSRRRGLHSMASSTCSALEVDAFAGGVGGEEDADGRVLGVKLESGFDALAVVGVLRAVEKLQAVAFLESAGGEVVVKPLLGIAVFREDDDPLLVPAAVGPDHVLEPFHEFVGLAVELGGGAFRPVSEVVEDLGVSGGWGPEGTGKV